MLESKTMKKIIKAVKNVLKPEDTQDINPEVLKTELECKVEVLEAQIKALQEAFDNRPR